MSFMKRLANIFQRREKEDSPLVTPPAQSHPGALEMLRAISKRENTTSATVLHTCFLNVVLLLPGLDTTVRTVIKCFLDGTLETDFDKRSLPSPGLGTRQTHSSSGAFKLWRRFLTPQTLSAQATPPHLTVPVVYPRIVIADDICSDIDDIPPPHLPGSGLTPPSLQYFGDTTASPSSVASPLSGNPASGHIHVLHSGGSDIAYGSNVQCKFIAEGKAAIHSPDVHLEVPAALSRLPLNARTLDNDSGLGFYEPHACESSGSGSSSNFPGDACEDGANALLDKEAGAQAHDNSQIIGRTGDCEDRRTSTASVRDEEDYYCDLSDNGDCDSSFPTSPEAPTPTTLTHGGVTYTIYGTLGEGAYGRVFYARMDDGEEVALKVFHKAKMHADDEEAREKHINVRSSAKQIENELEILKAVTDIDTPFLTQLLRSFQDEDNIYFVMRMFPEDFRRCLLARRKMDLPDIKNYAAELLLGLEALHSINVMHRDLKPENILVSPTGHLAICDFGMSRAFKHKNFAKCTAHDHVGTPIYQAPEVQQDTLHIGGYTCAIDIWGFALILLEMFIGSGRPFFEGLERDSVDRSIFLHIIELHVPDVAAQDLLISILLMGDPKSRPSLEQVRAHPFFYRTKWAVIENRRWTPPYIPRFTGPRKPGTSYCFSTFHLGSWKEEKTKISDTILAFECDASIWEDPDHGDSSWYPDTTSLGAVVST